MWGDNQEKGGDSLGYKKIRKKYYFKGTNELSQRKFEGGEWDFPCDWLFIS